MMRFWNDSGISWTICNLTDNHTNTSSLYFYRLDALPHAQPINSVRAQTDISLYNN